MIQTYLCPLMDVVVNFPVWYVYTYTHYFTVVNTPLVASFLGYWVNASLVRYPSWMTYFVDLVLFIVLYIWPLVLACDIGRYSLILDIVSAGHALKYPHCIVSINILHMG